MWSSATVHAKFAKDKCGLRAALFFPFFLTLFSGHSIPTKDKRDKKKHTQTFKN